MTDPQETMFPGETDLRRAEGEAMTPIPDRPVSPPDPQPWTEHECGCRERPWSPTNACGLHRVAGPGSAACVVIVRALFAVAGAVAAGRAPAEAVEDVRRRFGI